jgi:hypothetical protein
MKLGIRNIQVGKTVLSGTWKDPTSMQTPFPTLEG